MSTQPVGTPDPGSGVALQRWLDVRSQPPVVGTTALAAAAAAHAAPTTRATLLPDALAAHRLDDSALGAHAAVGELAVQRQTYADIEGAIAATGRHLTPRLQAVDAAYARAAAAPRWVTDAPEDPRTIDRESDRRTLARAADARRRSAETVQARATQARATEAQAAEARAAEDAAAAHDIHDAVTAAVTEFHETDRRLDALRESARAAVHETARRVAEVADEIAASNRSQEQDRAGDRAADTRDERDARAALERRDAAVRELGRLLGATARQNEDGTVDVNVGGRPIVERGRAARIAATAHDDGAVRLTVDDTPLDKTSGTLAALTGAGERAITSARERLADVARAFADEVQHRQETGRVDTTPGPRERVEATDPASPTPSTAATRVPRLVEVDTHGRLQVSGGPDDVALPALARDAAPTGASAAEAFHGSDDTDVQGVPGTTDAGSGVVADRVRPTPVRGVERGPDASPPAWPAEGPVPGSGPASPTGTGTGTVTRPAAGHATTPPPATGPVAGNAPSSARDAVAGAGAIDPTTAATVAAAQGRFATAAADVIGDLLTDVTRRRQVAERRLDVLSVVDSVLAGAPSSQVGGLVRTALGAITPADVGGARTSQLVVSALQGLDAQASALGRAADAVLASPTAAAIVVSAGDPSQLSATLFAAPATVTAAAVQPPAASVESAGATDPTDVHDTTDLAAQNPDVAAAPADVRGSSILGRFGDLLGALGSVFRSDAQDPTPPLDATVTVTSLAHTGATASQAAFPTGHVLAGGARFGLTLTEGVGDQAAVHRVVVGPGATLATVADAVNAVATHVHATTVPAGQSQERLLLGGVGAGARTFADLTDGRIATAPSAVLGAFHPVERATDTVAEVRVGDGPTRTVTSTTPTLTDALPGVQLTLAPGAVGQTFEVTALPGAAALADRVDDLVTSASALLTTLGGAAGILGSGAASVFAGDPVVGDLASRVAAALAGASALTPSVADPAGADPTTLDDGARARAVALAPVAGVRASATSGQGATFDRDAFLRAYAQDPAGTEDGVHRLAREVAGVTSAATDPRTGFLAVRILGEQSFAHEYGIGQADAEERMHDRHDVFTRRAHAMQTLLGRLDDQRTWLQENLA